MKTVLSELRPASQSSKDNAPCLLLKTHKDEVLSKSGLAAQPPLRESSVLKAFLSKFKGGGNTNSNSFINNDEMAHTALTPFFMSTSGCHRDAAARNAWGALPGCASASESPQTSPLTRPRLWPHQPLSFL